MTTTIVTKPPATTPGPAPGRDLLGADHLRHAAGRCGRRVHVTTGLVALLPRLRAMAPRRRTAHLAASAVIQAVLVVIYGYLTLLAASGSLD